MEASDNVALVATAFAALAMGDTSYFSPEYTHLGYDIVLEFARALNVQLD